jgi:hypothetical protein
VAVWQNLLNASFSIISLLSYQFLFFILDFLFFILDFRVFSGGFSNDQNYRIRLLFRVVKKQPLPIESIFSKLS